MATVSGHPTGYDSGYSAYSVSGLANGETDSSSTNYATINLTRGSAATTEIYYTFSLNIPSGATINSVSCSCKCYISSTSSSYISSRTVQLYSGSSSKGSASTVSNSTTAFDMSCGTWTAAELNNAKLRIYGKRASKNTNTNYYFRFYGATLTVDYTEASTGLPIRVKVNGAWVTPTKLLVKQSGSWVQASGIKAKSGGSWH